MSLKMNVRPSRTTSSVLPPTTRSSTRKLLCSLAARDQERPRIFLKLRANCGRIAAIWLRVIQPPSYELESVVTLLRDYYQRAEHGFLVQSLWKFLIYSEIAQSAFAEIGARTVPPQDGSPEDASQLSFGNTRAFCTLISQSRLEAAVDAVRILPREGGVGHKRMQISEALHDGMIRELRLHLGNLLAKRTGLQYSSITWTRRGRDMAMSST